MLNQLTFALVNGVATGVAVFLVAAGVTLIFGLLRVLNFAHGSFFMLGAYLAFTLSGLLGNSVAGFLLAAVVAGLIVGLLGLVAEYAVLRRLRHYDEAYSLIATFALMMLLDGAIKLIWGVNYFSASPPDILNGVALFGQVIVPIYSAFVILLGIAVFAALDLAIHRLWIGKIVQALAHDQWMAGFVGVNVPLMLTGTVIAAFFLAGLAGGVLLPNQSLSPNLSHAFLLQAFVVVIIGGLGNIRGAFVAALILGLVESLNSLLLPGRPGIAMYVAMVVFMLWRPEGLFAAGRGAPQPVHAHLSAPASSFDWERHRRSLTLVGIAIAAIFAAMPLWAGQGALFLGGLALIAALFALSWNLLFGTTGLATFGHAAFFAIGAYACGAMLKDTSGFYFIPILIGSAILGAIVAAIVGAIAIRRATGIALAILTLALSEILRMTISTTIWLGRDDGLSGVPRPRLDLGFAQISLQGSTSYFLFLFVTCGGVALILWWLTAGSFGRALRAIRQDAERTAFLGVNVKRMRLIAFVISGGVAALAGALQAPWVQIVTPDSAGYLVSTQPMLATLLGGASFFWGPVVGSVLFSILEHSASSLIGLSELATGGILLTVVLGAPDGVLGIIQRLGGRASAETKSGVDMLAAKTS